MSTIISNLLGTLTWEQLTADSADGSYATKYKVGQTLSLPNANGTAVKYRMSYVTQFNTYTVIKREIKKYLLMFPAGKILSKKVKNSVLDPFERKTCTADTEKTSS